MRPLPSHGHALALLACLALVTCRSLVWLIWPHSYFDSDQAVYGLMAKHISEGRAFPVFMYGQNYTLAIDAWLAAPVFALIGSTVFALKLPVFALNLAIAFLLVWLLRRDSRLSILEACVAAAFFIAAPPLASSRLLEASGGNIATLFFTLVLWILRRRPVLLGLAAGIAFANRDFTWYPIAALLLVEWWEQGSMNRGRLLAWGKTAAIAAVVVGGFQVLARQGPVLGPGTSGTGFGPLQIRKPGALGCFDTTELASNVDWMLRGNLAAQFGWEPELPSAYSVASGLEIGHTWALWPLALLAALFVVAAVGGRTAGGAGDARGRPLFAAYLLIVGVESALAYAALTCDVQQPTLLRYTLLTLVGAAGGVAWILQCTRSRVVRGATLASVMVWAAASAWDTGRLLDEYVRRRPPDATGELISELDRRGVRYGRGSYWTAYDVAFRSRERIIVAADRYGRIADYQRQVDVQPAGTVVDIRPEPCATGLPPTAGWCLTLASR